MILPNQKKCLPKYCRKEAHSPTLKKLGSGDFKNEKKRLAFTYLALSHLWYSSMGAT